MGVRKTNCRGRLTRSGTIAGSLPQLANMLTIQELQTWKRNTRINIVPDKKLAYLFGEPLASHRQSLNGGPKAVLSGARGRTPEKLVWRAQDAFFEPDALPDGWHAARATH